MKKLNKIAQRKGTTVKYSGKTYPSVKALCLGVKSTVSSSQASSRIHGYCRKHQKVATEIPHDRLHDALFLSVEDYRFKYGTRRSYIQFKGREWQRKDLHKVYGTKISACYRLFQQRLRKLETRFGSPLDDIQIINALELNAQEYRDRYPAGNSKPFTYTGQQFPEHTGSTFPSLKLFLNLIGLEREYGNFKNRSKDDNYISQKIDMWPEYYAPPSSKGLIYKITCRKTGLSYVGRTYFSANKRWIGHKQSAKEESNTVFHKAIRQHGCESFTIEVLESDIHETLLGSRETYWIEECGTLTPKGYNSVAGAVSARRKGKIIYIGGRKFIGIAGLAEELHEESGVAQHVIIKRYKKGIRSYAELTESARVHSDHQMAGTGIWRRWKSMWNKYKEPGEICDAWKDFDRWFEDIGQYEKPEHHIVRVDDRLPWQVDNVNWVSVQSKIENVHGKTQKAFGKEYPSIKALAEAFGIGTSTLKYRINAKGMTPEDAVKTPKGPSSGQPFEYQGVIYKSRHAAAVVLAPKYGLTYHQARDRLTRKVPLDKKSPGI